MCEVALQEYGAHRRKPSHSSSWCGRQEWRAGSGPYHEDHPGLGDCSRDPTCTSCSSLITTSGSRNSIQVLDEGDEDGDQKNRSYKLLHNEMKDCTWALACAHIPRRCRTCSAGFVNREVEGSLT